jgi:predicted sugar kinase
MTTVRVAAPARLHMGMLDASGEGPRRFGGLGVAITRPAAIVEATAAGELSVDGPDAERARVVAERVLSGRGAGLRVIEAIPPHAGLGSGTKLALAVTAALCALHGRAPEPAAMARLAGRGARSAVGLWTFALGGFVLEGGRRHDSDEPGEFGAALTELQRLVGDSFAPVQRGTFHPRAAPLVDALLRLGAAGAGQSSWGPAVYGIVGSEAQGRAIAERLDAEYVEIVGFANAGARVEEVA